MNRETEEEKIKKNEYVKEFDTRAENGRVSFYWAGLHRHYSYKRTCDAYSTGRRWGANQRKHIHESIGGHKLDSLHRFFGCFDMRPPQPKHPVLGVRRGSYLWHE